MISVAFWVVTLVPNLDQYYCVLKWMESNQANLCYYWCSNKVRGFNWFEVKKEKGCKIRKKFYKT